MSRKELEPTLTQVVTWAVGSFVLAVDGSWGSGKTTFLNMWEVKLNEAGHLCLYLNAWKSDFVEDPLVAVVGELSIAIKKSRPDNGNVDATIKKFEETAKSVLKRLITIGVKIATHGALDIDTASEKILSDLAGETAQDLIKDYCKGKSDIDDFREELSSLVAAIQKSDREPVKIVIIIDELDRCRPTYAVQLLERIKHLFDVEGIVFVLGIDREQLSHSIKALYGSEFDATGYLKRFIDLDYRLPEPDLGCYCSSLFEKFEINSLIARRHSENNDNNPDDLIDLNFYLGYLISSAQMSLREQEQIISRLRVVLQTIPVCENPFPVTLSILLFLHNYSNPEIYKSVMAGKLTPDDFLTFVEALPKEKEAFLLFSDSANRKNYSGFFKGKMKGIFLSGLNELLNTPSPEMQAYIQRINSRDNSSNEDRHIVQIAREGAGFQKTAQRLNLISNFERY
ncbi:KAP family P-loop NTPase fold protein [Chamaesiphon polymorphus]|uniref:KAP family P-loop NTPase fold protein n=1 Tax=Chamaesiphon polymorphus TaxID=2107691 RepID=UPI0015E776C4|nr:P-loop NTPase fold protein [Chamaesiphon polymorphus]